MKLIIATLLAGITVGVKVFSQDHFTHPANENLLQVDDAQPKALDQWKNGLKFECSQYIYDPDLKQHLNDWHIVKIQSDNGKNFTWTNKAGVSWTLTPSKTDPMTKRITEFDVEEDCPYYKDGYKKAKVEIASNGRLLYIVGPGGEKYSYVTKWTLQNMQIDMPNPWIQGLNFECSKYINTPTLNDWHFVTISNPSGDNVHFEWKNRAGVSWSLIPVYDFVNHKNMMAEARIEHFNVGMNCPYYDNHKTAWFRYNEQGTLLRVRGPGKEVYNHVVSFTPKLPSTDAECQDLGYAQYWKEMGQCITAWEHTEETNGHRGLLTVHLYDGSVVSRAVINNGNQSNVIKDFGEGQSAGLAFKTWCKAMGFPYKKAEAWGPERVAKDVTWVGRKIRPNIKTWHVTCAPADLAKGNVLACSHIELGDETDKSIDGFVHCKD